MLRALYGLPDDPYATARRKPLWDEPSNPRWPYAVLFGVFVMGAAWVLWATK